ARDHHLLERQPELQRRQLLGEARHGGSPGVPEQVRPVTKSPFPEKGDTGGRKSTYRIVRGCGSGFRSSSPWWRRFAPPVRRTRSSAAPPMATRTSAV